MKNSLLKLFLIFYVIFFNITLYKKSYADNIVVGYYYSDGNTPLTIDNIQFENITYLCHAFLWPNNDGSISGDIYNQRLLTLAHQHNVSVLVALGGWGNCGGFSSMTFSAETRENFISNLIDICQIYGYDGVDIDWEYPGKDDTKNLNLLIQEIREAFDNVNEELLITMAVPAGSWNGKYFDFQSLKKNINWFGCMTYDFFGSWVDKAGHNSPLYPPLQNNNGSVKSGIDYLVNVRLISSDKIIVGIPFYGRGCNAVGLNQPNTGGNTEYSYSEIVPKIGNNWNYFWDDICKVPYLLNNDETKFITYDDTQSVRLKCEYTIKRGLKGVMIWALGHDLLEGKQPLLQTVAETMNINTSIDNEKYHKMELLSDNYPNPFNPLTSVILTLKSKCNISLKVYNLKGQIVKLIVDNESLRSGQYLYRINLKDHPSGVYFYVLESDSKRISKKMILYQ